MLERLTPFLTYLLNDGDLALKQLFGGLWLPCFLNQGTCSDRSDFAAE